MPLRRRSFATAGFRKVAIMSYVLLDYFEGLVLTILSSIASLLAVARQSSAICYGNFAAQLVSANSQVMPRA
jgi:hypothetical protein